MSDAIMATPGFDAGFADGYERGFAAAREAAAHVAEHELMVLDLDDVSRRSPMLVMLRVRAMVAERIAALTSASQAAGVRGAEMAREQVEIMKELGASEELVRTVSSALPGTPASQAAAPPAPEPVAKRGCVRCGYWVCECALPMPQPAPEPSGCVCAETSMRNCPVHAETAPEPKRCAAPGCTLRPDPRWFYHVSGISLPSCDGHGCAPGQPCDGCRASAQDEAIAAGEKAAQDRYDQRLDEERGAYRFAREPAGEKEGE